jgi:hypothetical protein
MVYNNQNHWVYGVCLLSGILNNLKNTTIQKLDLFPSLGEGRKAHTPLGLLENANFSYWTLHFIKIQYDLMVGIHPVIEVSSY